MNAFPWMRLDLPSTVDLYWPFPWLPEGQVISWRRGVWSVDRFTLPGSVWAARKPIAFPWRADLK